MHEYSIAEGIADSILPAAFDNGATRVSVVRLRIGEMSDIVRDALDFAWGVVCEERGDVLAGCRLEVESVSPHFVCMDCGNEYDADRLHPRCPSCGSGKTLLTKGRELEIASFDIETETDDEPDAPDDEPDDSGEAPGGAHGPRGRAPRSRPVPGASSQAN
jgi:hydrogenase nickel incorporation protein HypA/HybF